MSKNKPFVIRQAVQTDLDFILSSSLKSFRGSWFAKNITNDVYFYEMEKQLKNKLKSGTVLIACASDEPNQIFSYLICEVLNEATIVHFAYTKHIYRKMGFCDALIDTVNDKQIFYTLETHASSHLSKKYKAIYNPFLFFNK